LDQQGKGGKKDKGCEIEKVIVFRVLREAYLNSGFATGFPSEKGGREPEIGERER